jgi:hypothetical protein
LYNDVTGSFRPKFRSYRPQDATLKETTLPDAKPGDVEAEVKDELGSGNIKVVIEELVSTLKTSRYTVMIIFRQGLMESILVYGFLSFTLMRHYLIYLAESILVYGFLSFTLMRHYVIYLYITLTSGIQ